MLHSRYGDISPYGDGLRLFTVFFVIIGVGMVGPAVGVLLSTYVDIDLTFYCIGSCRGFDQSS